MRRSILGVPGLLMLLAIMSAGGGRASAGQFDGQWSVTLVCPKSPDGALPFTFEFSADVKDGVLHGERGQSGSPGFMSLDGNIQHNGDADLKAHGLTGHSEYNIDKTARGVPYSHAVTAHFDAAQGTGQWVTPRVCKFTFTKL
jgi:hypothetical protein